MDLFPTLTPSCRESYLAALRLIRHMGDKNTHIDILSASPFPTHNSATTHAYKYALDWQSYSPDFGVQSISTWFKRKVCRVWACLILAAYQPLHTERLSNKMLMGPERHLLNEWMNEWMNAWYRLNFKASQVPLLLGKWLGSYEVLFVSFLRKAL